MTKNTVDIATHYQNTVPTFDRTAIEKRAVEMWEDYKHRGLSLEKALLAAPFALQTEQDLLNALPENDKTDYTKFQARRYANRDALGSIGFFLERKTGAHQKAAPVYSGS